MPNPKAGCVRGRRKTAGFLHRRSDGGVAKLEVKAFATSGRTYTQTLKAFRPPVFTSCRRCRRTVLRPPRTLSTDGSCRRLHPLFSVSLLVLIHHRPIANHHAYWKADRQICGEGEKRCAAHCWRDYSRSGALHRCWIFRYGILSFRYTSHFWYCAGLSLHSVVCAVNGYRI